MSKKHHFEPFLHLAGLGHDKALISWGGFYFDVDDGPAGPRYRIVDDEDLGHVHPTRVETIGARSSSYGHAVVEAWDESGRCACRVEARDCNWVWLEGLMPECEYRYRVTVDGKPWAEGELMEWEELEDGSQGLVACGRRYDNRFRTFPHPEQEISFSFVVLGDFGVGIQIPNEDGRRQRDVARALERVALERDARLMLTTGDNIYYSHDYEEETGTGAEDDDWYHTFYQPYRYVINRIPVYPAVGNHDTGEQEESDDRQQLADNFFTEERFVARAEIDKASIDPGLYYRFRVGSGAEFVSLDTSEDPDCPSGHFFDREKHQEFLREVFHEGANDERWVLPFAHHPPYCAGPHHCNNDPMMRLVLPHLKRAGVRVMLCGHEHNFQVGAAEGFCYVITGAGGRLRPEKPTPQGFRDAGTVGWAAEGHFLFVELTPEKLVVHPVAGVEEGGELRLVGAVAPDGSSVRLPLVYRRRP